MAQQGLKEVIEIGVDYSREDWIRIAALSRIWKRTATSPKHEVALKEWIDYLFLSSKQR